MTAPRALVCSHYLPQPDLDSYSRRLFHLVGCLRAAGWDVACVARSPQGVAIHGPVLEARGITVAAGFAAHLDNVRQAATAGPCDVALLGFWNFAEPLVRLLRAVRPRARLIVDSGDLHFLRNTRRILRGAPRQLDLLPPDHAAEMAREINVYAAADAVLTVSAKEAGIIADLIGDPCRVHVVPDGEDLAPSPVPVAERCGTFFVGNFEHPPNVEAVRFLVGEVLPQLDPDLRARHPLYIAGSNLTAEVRALCAVWPDIRLVGWVPTVVPYFERARVSLLPVLHGAGTKRKLIQALAVGTPTVSTGVGVEGFDLEEGDGVLVADDPFPFAETIGRLLTDDGLWQTVAARGRERILRHHALAVVRERFLTALAAVRTAADPVGVAPPPMPAGDAAIPLVLPAGARRSGRSLPVRSPEISIVIPTRNRAGLLTESLASLAAQEGVDGRYEVVVVDDGSTDDTAAVCREWGERLPLELITAPAGGISAAKNLGIEAAAAPLLLFFDDDDVAAPDLVARHLAAHRRHPLEHTAVLGHTDWSPRLEVTEVMRYVTEVGCYLFGYPHLRHGATYDHRFFWGGRSSCKRALLVAAGGFRPEFTFGSEDIEAGYRMSRMLAHRRRPAVAGAAGGVTGGATVELVVVYDSRARQHVIRPLTYDEFCRRCERQGWSQWQFAGFYADPHVAEWCGTTGALERWAAVGDELPARVARVHDLEADRGRRAAADAARLAELHRLYGWTFDAFKLKGIVAAAAAARPRPEAGR
jgi:glycosyltransferase involved in cell wall biosynthesis